ncbi:MAG TPA: GerMN domain-containing protein [Bacillota bacterium]|nr:GerMN domain-containing protein [Bacillota bacterium]
MLKKRWFKLMLVALVLAAVAVPAAYLATSHFSGAASPVAPDQDFGKGSEANDDVHFLGEPDHAPPPPSEDPVVEPAAAPDSQPERKLALQLFFADEKALAAGECGPCGYVAPVTRVVPFQEAVLRLALQELIRGPLEGEQGAGRTLPAGTRLLNLELKNGVAIIDFSPEVLEHSPGGSLGGIVFIQSVVYTATQFPAVEAVQVLVTGHPWEDGHFFWDKPLSRQDLTEQFSL